ncbi:MAG: alkaline phosphatase [Massilia sp.]
MRLLPLASAIILGLLTGCASTTPAPSAGAKNILFFLGDGMGVSTITAARIYAVGENGQLALDTLPYSASVKTYSRDAQVTDSAAGMSTYMTGVKVNNNVLSMSGETIAAAPLADANGNKQVSACTNGAPAPTLLELARRRGQAVGVVTTTRITDATPAATYAHACHRGAESEIAAALVPGGAGYNGALGDGVDVILGGGSRAFIGAGKGGKRADGRDLLAEMGARGYRVVTDSAQLTSTTPRAGQKLIGLFAPANLSFEALRDPAKEPGLAEMTSAAIAQLSTNPNGFFLMVEGGQIDVALHATNAKRALQETASFDQAIATAIARMQVIDPGLKHTLIVATADHDHSLQINGYSPRTGKTTAEAPGVLGLARNMDGKLRLDAEGMPYTILSFGTGEHREPGSRASAAPLTDAIVAADDYHQEAAVRSGKGGEAHGGANVFLGALGAGAERFHGTIENIAVFDLIRGASGL